MTQSANLDGRSYTFTFDWSERADTWSLSIRDASGAAVILGARLVPFTDLLRTVASDNRPPGSLVLFSEEAPTIETIGLASLIYLTEDELS